MAERCFPLNNITYTAEDMQLFLCTRSSGVFSSDACLQVSKAGGLSVSVASGIAWLKIGDFAGVVYANDAAKQLTCDAADATYARIDRIIVRYSTAFANKMPKLMILKGTAAATPAAPAITRSESITDISLAQVYVAAGATEITSVTDEREDETVCGLMTDGTRQISVNLQGTATGAIYANVAAAAETGAQMRSISYGTDALTAGTDALPTGTVYLQYE